MIQSSALKQQLRATFHSNVRVTMGLKFIHIVSEIIKESTSFFSFWHFSNEAFCWSGNTEQNAQAWGNNWGNNVFYLFLLSVKSDTSIAQLYIQAYYIMALMTQQ